MRVLTLSIGRQFSFPTYPFIVSIWLGMALLCLGAIGQGRSNVEEARHRYEQTQANLKAIEAANQKLTRQLATIPAHTNQLAHEKLGYVKPSEIVIVVK